ncbi:hypothetical protein J6590_092330 [Homalodisca vitripennis]|nr:hypothetical protein J6590_092330 [Homalodisca vitripennis]
MHVMEGECDQSSEMVAESAPDLVSAKATDIKLSKEELPQAEQLSEVTKEVVKSPESDEVKTSASEPEQEVAVNGESQDKGDSVGDLCVENGKEEDRTKVEPSVGDKEDAKDTVRDVPVPVQVPVQEVKEGGSGGCSEEEDRNSVTSCQYLDLSPSEIITARNGLEKSRPEQIQFSSRSAEDRPDVIISHIGANGEASQLECT